MDINDIRAFSTVLMMITFIGICWWAFAPRRKKRFEDAANLPFADESSADSKTPSSDK
ncbi:MAG: cbb3-type cytochrome c oxidase subunit 3 [Pseudomonadota bacterium]|jgi:cytochrome c oxidase cbb3-type subunit 4|nr:cbb3-type cytochrome c oxidase subunit 3 [Pseudomonadota bacterium]